MGKAIKLGAPLQSTHAESQNWVHGGHRGKGRVTSRLSRRAKERHAMQQGVK